MSATSSADAQWSKVDLLLATGVVVWAAVLRLHLLGFRNLTIDEVTSPYIVRLPRREFAEAVSREELFSAVYCLQLRGWIHGGQSEFANRMLSAVIGLATLPVLYALGARVFGSRVGNAFHIHYSQTARTYSLLVFLACLCSLFFVRAMEKPSARNWPAYTPSAALSNYSHFFAVLVLVSHRASFSLLRLRELTCQCGWPAEN